MGGAEVKGSRSKRRLDNVREPTDITELKLFCTEEWAKIPLNQCAGLINSYWGTERNTPVLFSEFNGRLQIRNLPDSYRPGVFITHVHVNMLSR